MIIGAILAGVALIMGPVAVPDEVVTLVTLVVALLFQMLWYGIIRVIELVRGKASALLGLGLVKTDPTYVTSSALPTSRIDLTSVTPVVSDPRHDVLIASLQADRILPGRLDAPPAVGGESVRIDATGTRDDERGAPGDEVKPA